MKFKKKKKKKNNKKSFDLRCENNRTVDLTVLILFVFINLKSNDKINGRH